MRTYCNLRTCTVGIHTTYVSTQQCPGGTNTPPIQEKSTPTFLLLKSDFFMCFDIQDSKSLF